MKALTRKFASGTTRSTGSGDLRGDLGLGEFRQTHVARQTLQEDRQRIRRGIARRGQRSDQPPDRCPRAASASMASATSGGTGMVIEAIRFMGPSLARPVPSPHQASERGTQGMRPTSIPSSRNSSASLSLASP